MPVSCFSSYWPFSQPGFLFQPSPGKQTSPPRIPPEETLEIKITDILEEKEIETPQGKQLYQRLECLVIKGFLKDQNISIDHGKIPVAGLPEYKEGGPAGRHSQSRSEWK